MLLVSGMITNGMLYELSDFIFAVFDTDGITMEVVTGETLFNAMQSGVVIENASINDQYFYTTDWGIFPHKIYRSKYLTALNMAYRYVDFIYKGKLFSFRSTPQTDLIINNKETVFRFSSGLQMCTGMLNMFGLVLKDERPSDLLYLQFNKLGCILDLNKGVLYHISNEWYFSGLTYKNKPVVWEGRGLPVDEKVYLRKYMLTGMV